MCSFQQTTHDIGLFRLDRDAVIKTGVLQPICLPTIFDKSDMVSKTEELEIYTAGWGRVFSACVTNEFGPVKSLKCQFPFSYKGRTHPTCATTIKTPSFKVLFLFVVNQTLQNCLSLGSLLQSFSQSSQFQISQRARGRNITENW